MGNAVGAPNHELTGQQKMAEPVTDDPVVKALLEEYKQLAWSFDRNGAVSSNLPPIVLTLITGLFFFGQVSSSQLVGFGVWLAALFLLIWLGLIQSVTNHFGVSLAALEIKINKRLSVEMDHGLSFYSKYVGRGSQIVKGFKHYFALLTLLTIIVIIPASIKSWSAMTSWNWPISFKMMGILIPPLLIIAVVAVMSYVDKWAVEEIDKQIRKAYPKHVLEGQSTASES
jgi:hypothetical protein